MGDNRGTEDRTERDLREWAVQMANYVQPNDNGLSAEGKLKNVLAAAAEIEKFVTR